MKPNVVFIFLLLELMVVFPDSALAFWGNDGEKHSGLNLESGYDPNTVTTVTGHIISIQTGEDRRNSQLEIVCNGNQITVMLGPQRYWAENGIALKAGDSISVHGSKAVGKDGVVYILAQELANITTKKTILLRNESGRPVWAGMGYGHGRMNNRPSQTPGRTGYGRMGR